MDIYVGGAIRGGRDEASTVARIIEYTKKYGDVLTEHLADPNLTSDGESLSDREIHDRDVEWLKSSRAVLFEGTVPSFGVGYEVANAVNNGKRTGCVYREGTRLSAMVAGSPGVVSFAYETDEEWKGFIDFMMTARAFGEREIIHFMDVSARYFGSRFPYNMSAIKVDGDTTLDIDFPGLEEIVDIANLNSDEGLESYLTASFKVWSEGIEPRFVNVVCGDGSPRIIDKGQSGLKEISIYGINNAGFFTSEIPDDLV